MKEIMSTLTMTLGTLLVTSSVSSNEAQSRFSFNSKPYMRIRRNLPKNMVLVAEGSVDLRNPE